MKNVDDLIENAAELADRGLSHGEIADELNVSRETASWLVQRGGADLTADQEQTGGPHDVHVDWSAIGRDSARLDHVSRALADLLVDGAVEENGTVDGGEANAPADEPVGLTVGIEKAGVPLATAVATTLGTDLATYTPRKHQWEEGDIEDLEGSFSRNFATVAGRECYVVDDTITSGTTLTETVEAIRAQGGDPVACAVLVDKQGVDEVDGVPVRSLVRVLRVGDRE